MEEGKEQKDQNGEAEQVLSHTLTLRYVRWPSIPPLYNAISFSLYTATLFLPLLRQHAFQTLFFCQDGRFCR